MQSTSFEYTLDPDHLAKAFGIHWRVFVKPLWKILLVAIGMLYFAFSVYLFYCADQILDWLFALLCFLLGFFFLFGFKLSRKLLIKRHIKKFPIRQDELWKWTVSNDNLHLSIVGHSELTMQWQSVVKALMFENGFMVYPHEKQYYVWPKSAFESSDDYANVEKLLKTNVKDFRRV